jgi:pimeloyl-ACP methyl ester carboxylesterase
VATSRPSSAPASATATAIAWKPCADGLECGSITVPMDERKPDGDRVRVVLARRPAADASNRVGSIVLGVGGPGASGTAFLRMLGPLFSDTVRARYDLVAFDARGIGLSDPIHCLAQRPPLEPAYATNDVEEARFRAYATAVAAACEANSGRLLPWMSTNRVVADLDAIRTALDEPQLTYVGWSYGTLLGALYADRYPDRVRAMVLDAPVDPGIDLEALLSQMAAGHQAQLDAFLERCRRSDGCAFAGGGDPSTAFRALIARFRAGPYDGVTERTALGGISAALSAGDFEGLETALDEVRAGDVDLLRAMGTGGGAEEATFLDPFDAVICTDMPGPRTSGEVAALADRLAAVSPDFGAFIAYTQFDCTAWPVEVQRTPAAVRAAGSPPILLLTSTGDPAATPEMARDVAAQLESAVLVERDGAGHTSIPSDACMTRVAEEYLVTLATPVPGTSCP